VGAEARCADEGLLSKTHENKVEKLQPQGGSHPAEHRTGQETKNLIEYVVVHEMVHLIEPMHSNQFILILHKNYPTWREARTELNQLSLTAEVWRE